MMTDMLFVVTSQQQYLIKFLGIFLGFFATGVKSVKSIGEYYVDCSGEEQNYLKIMFKRPRKLKVREIANTARSETTPVIY